MASEFDETAELLLAGKTVRAALLLTMIYTDDSVLRYWTGMNDITISAAVYKGGGRVVSIDGLMASAGTTSQNATFKLSGVDPEINAKLADEADLAIGADISVAVQVFGDGENGGEWQPIDDPVAIGTWEGDSTSFDRQGPGQRSVSLVGVGYWATRSRQISAYYSASDQQRRYPGDRGGEFMASLTNKQRTWPNRIF